MYNHTSIQKMYRCKFPAPFLLFLLLPGLLFARPKEFQLSSPNGHLKVAIVLNDKIRYSIQADGQSLLAGNYLALETQNETFGVNPSLISAKNTSHNEVIKPYVSLKFSTVNSVYNDLLLTFKGGYDVEFRAFDDGVAYRFITHKKDKLQVTNEDFAINFGKDYQLTLQQVHGFKTSYEEPYINVQSANWNEGQKMSTLPALVNTSSGYKILISESGVINYPCMFLQPSAEGAKGAFPKVPLEFGPDGDRSQKILKSADYIAEIPGTSELPWRYFVIAHNDRQLIENTMTLRLAPKSVLPDVSWVKPGKASWEWWNGAIPYGPDVNFVAGCNLQTYKYYIDFASKFGIKYIVMDEGWAKSTTDPYTPNPDVDLKELIRYGKEKHVDIILWLTWLTVHNNMGLFKTFHDWGIKGVKIDFMDRSDQWMVNFYEDVAKEAAKNEIIVDFHGAFKPAGLEYKYPNVISYEGVRGMEQMGGCTPDNSVYYPFMRNAVGPMDYTPGAMISMQPEVYNASRPNAASIGTRAYQMALFVVFESGLQMLADNPTLYYRNLDCTQFIASVPTTWDETKALAADAGQLAIVAKRKGDEWFIGGITNNKQQERQTEINLSFLKPGKTYTMTYFEDGINADRQAMDYRKKTIEVKAGDKFTIHMVRNGGFAAVIK